MNTIVGTTRSSRRRLHWVIVGAMALLLALLISGCDGGANIAPLAPNAFADLGREMTALEGLTSDQLAAVGRLKPTEIEFIGRLTPAQLKNLRGLTDADLSAMPLGVNTAVVASLQPAQLAFIQHLTDVRDIDAVQTLTLHRLSAADARAAANKKAPDNPMPPKEREAFATFWRGYIAETRATRQDDQSVYLETNGLYQQSAQAGGGYAAQARYRLGVLGTDPRHLLGEQSVTIANTNLQAIAPYRSSGGIFGSAPEIMLWVRTPALAGQDGAAAVDAAAPPRFVSADAPTVASALLDTLYRTSPGTNGWYYRAVAVYVALFKFAGGFGPALALIMLALLIKLVTIPLTNASFRGMRDMQRVQPLIKDLQEKYKNDKQKFAEEQMKLMKEHKVNPLGGCLPLLIQIPIFIVVYQAVRVYSAGFAGSGFLWVPNLAKPDWILLLLYTASMIVTQKLTATPSTDPQQKMMQTQMTYIMPIFLLIVLKNIASAFVLYWFFLNVFSSLHQYYLLQMFKREDEAKGLAPVPAPVKPGPMKKKGK